MIILSTLKQLEKKPMKKFYKIIVSDVISDDEVQDEFKQAVSTREFLPDPMLFMNFANGLISKKRYKKEYWKELERDENKFLSLLTIMILYRKGEPVCLACDSSEKEYLYLQFLADYISARYGVAIGDYSDVKDGKLPKNKIKDRKRLEKDIKFYKKDLEEIMGYKEKKAKKKKDKKKDKDSKKKKKKKESKADKKLLKDIEDRALEDYYKKKFEEDEEEFESVFDTGIEIVETVYKRKLFKNR